MSQTSPIKTTVLLSYLLAGVLAASSLGGIFLPEIYAKETPSWAAQGIGQDWVDLLLVVPLLLFFAVMVERERKVFLLLLGGILTYLVYSYLIYAFFMHFNRLFFLYNAGLGLSVYSLVLLADHLKDARVESWFDRARSTKLPSFYLLLTTAFFYLLWLKEDLPAFLSGTAPQSLEEAGLITNPVHVLDLSIVLPAMLIASIQLLRKKPFGYRFFPILMVFSMVMGAALSGMMAAMKWRGVSGDLTPAYVFGVLVITSSGILWRFLQTMKKTLA